MPDSIPLRQFRRPCSLVALEPFVDVVAWLEELGLSEYSAAFAENRIDMSVLPLLSEDDLKQLGVLPLGDRKKLLAAITRLPPQNDVATSSASDALPSVSPAPLVYTPRHLAARILAARSDIEGERKHVTVLFADIRGSTSLIEHLDPEEAGRMLGPAVSLMMTAVHDYEGTVNKIQGDGIMALFGAPLAHEDHAVRACLAALAMRDAVAHAPERKLTLRIGLHSGEVLVRAIHHDLSIDYDAVGATVHLASRMEQLAAPGAICITGATEALARDFVRTRGLGPTPVKGLSRAVNVYEVIGRREQRTRWDARGTRELTAFVGRSGELESLLKAAERARFGRGELVAIVGDAGMGKSRLVHELMRSPQVKGWLVLKSGTLPYGKSSPFLPVGMLLRVLFGIEAPDTRDDVEAKVRETLRRAGRDTAGLLQAARSLLNLPIDDTGWERLDPQQRGNRIVEEVKGFLFHLTKERPCLLIIEDLHWTDAETQRLLDALVAGLPAHRLLLVVTYRPEYRHAWAGKSCYRQVRVDPLEGADAHEMLDRLLGEGAELDALKRTLIERAAGWPLFIEELVRALKEAGILVEREGRIHVEGEIGKVRLPGSVQDVLASRIDRLAPELKRVLQIASVIGRSVPVRLLEAATGLSQEIVQARLSKLQDAEFLFEQHGGGDPIFEFKHALTEEVAYASLTQTVRRKLHGTLVDAIESAYGARLEEHFEDLARHALGAERWEQAYVYSRKAAKKAHARSAYRAAIDWFDRALLALDHLPDDGARVTDKMDVRLEMRTALWPLGRHEELARRVLEAGALAERIGDRARLANVFNYMTAHHWQAGKHNEAIEAGERGLELARQVGDFSVMVTTMQHLGFALLARGDFERQTALHREVAHLLTGDPAYERHGMAGYPAAITRGALAWGLAERGEFDEAFSAAHDGIAIARKVNSAMSIVWVTDYLALAHLLRGEPAEAIALMEPNIELCRSAEVRLVYSLTAGILGSALTAVGRAEAAVEVLEEAVHPKNLRHHPEGSGYPMVWSALAYLAAGRVDDALAQAVRAKDVAISQSEKGHEAWAWFAQAETKTQLDADDEDAVAGYCQALAIAEERGMRPLMARCRSRLATSSSGTFRR